MWVAMLTLITVCILVAEGSAHTPKDLGCGFDTEIWGTFTTQLNAFAKYFSKRDCAAYFVLAVTFDFKVVRISNTHMHVGVS